MTIFEKVKAFRLANRVALLQQRLRVLNDMRADPDLNDGPEADAELAEAENEITEELKQYANENCLS